MEEYMKERLRLAHQDDLKTVIEIYEHIHEDLQNTVNYPKWPKGIYPNDESAKEAFDNQELYVFEVDDEMVGSVILNHHQDDGYNQADWFVEADEKDVMVIHTLSIEPSKKGKGFASDMIKHIKALAMQKHCLALRLDITEHNLPARRLYIKNGFYFTGIADSHRQDAGIKYCEMFEYNLNHPQDRLDFIEKLIHDFVEERDWHQYHTADNLSKSIMIEAAELLECFQWDDDYDFTHVCEELADVLIYSIQLSQYLNVDIKEIICQKMIKNKKKYPIEKTT